MSLGDGGKIPLMISEGRGPYQFAEAQIEYHEYSASQQVEHELFVSGNELLRWHTQDEKGKLFIYYIMHNVEVKPPIYTRGRW